MSVAVEQEKICKAAEERNVSSPEGAFDPSIGRSPMIDDQTYLSHQTQCGCKWVEPP